MAKKWKIRITDPRGHDIPALCKEFPNKNEAMKYAGEQYAEGGRGKLKSVFIEPPFGEPIFKDDPPADKKKTKRKPNG